MTVSKSFSHLSSLCNQLIAHILRLDRPRVPENVLSFASGGGPIVIRRHTLVSYRTTWVNLGGMSCTIAGPRAWFRHVQSGSPRENTLFRNTEFEFKIFHFANQTVSQPSARTYLVV